MGKTNPLLREIRDMDYSNKDIHNIKVENKDNFIKNYRQEHDVATEIQELENISSALPNNHIFYYVYTMYLKDILNSYLNDNKKINNYKFLAHDRFVANQARIFVKNIIDKCLDINISKKTIMADRFSEMTKEYDNESIYESRMRVSQSEYDFYPEEMYNYIGFNNEKSELCQVIYPTSINDIIYYLAMQQILHETRYNVCKNCGRYFVIIGHKGAEYCERFIDDSGKTCKDIGAMTKYRNKKNEDPIFKAYNKAYKTNNARIRYGKITREMFKDWSKNARIMRDKCYGGEFTLEEFVYWLESDMGFLGILEIK